jgi:hypothetical protein
MGGSEPAGLGMSLDSLIKKSTAPAPAGGRGAGGRGAGDRSAGGARHPGVREAGVHKPTLNTALSGPSGGRGGGRFAPAGGRGGGAPQGGRGVPGRGAGGGGVPQYAAGGRGGGQHMQHMGQGRGYGNTGGGDNSAAMMMQMQQRLREQEMMIAHMMGQQQQQAQAMATQMRMGAAAPSVPAHMMGGMKQQPAPPVGARGGMSSGHAMAVAAEPAYEDEITELECTLDASGGIVVTLQGTVIVSVTAQGAVTLSTGGWWVSETVAGMNRALRPINVSVTAQGDPEDGNWTLKDGAKLQRFADEMTLQPRGQSAARAMVRHASAACMHARPINAVAAIHRTS